MKVVMVGPYPEPGALIGGGVARVIDTLLPELARHIDLTLVVPGAKADAEATSHGVRTVYLKRGPGPGVMSYWTVDARRLAEAVQAELPDLVHLQGVAGVGRKISLPRVMTVHGILHRDIVFGGRRWELVARQAAALLMRVIEKRARLQIANTIVINPYVTEALPDVRRQRQFAIPNPIDARFCEPRQEPLSGRRQRIISVGGIGPRKDTARIIRIANWVLRGDSETSLAICGGATDENYLQACIELSHAEGTVAQIDWVGNVAAENLRFQLDQAAVLLMASRQETAPMAIAEAHARGVAVVAPEAFGIKHMISPAKNGFFLPKGDVEAQARVLRAALDHSWNRAEIAAEARATYSPEHVAEMTLAAYRAVLEYKRAASLGATAMPRSGLDPAIEARHQLGRL